MATLQFSGIQDIVNSTLKELGKGPIEQVAQSYPGYPTCDYFFRREGRMSLSDGYAIQRSVWIRKQNVATDTALYEADDVNVENLTTTATIPWRFYKSYWAYDDREFLANAGESRIFDMIKVRRSNAWLSMIEKLDADIWTLPATTNTRSLYGIPYYLVKNATAGFNGGHPSGYSDVAGISRTTYANWKNYTATYTLNTITKADIITTLRTAFRAMRWQDIEGMSIEDYRRGRDKYVLLVNNATMGGFENVGEAQNENLGKDVASFEGQKDIYRADGTLTFRRKPIVFDPYLDNDSTNPIYVMDLSTWCMYVMKKLNMEQTEPTLIGDGHHSYAVWYDLGCNLMCFDPRRNGVFYGV